VKAGDFTDPRSSDEVWTAKLVMFRVNLWAVSWGAKATIHELTRSHAIVDGRAVEYWFSLDFDRYFINTAALAR
jgi:hypothetical protein